MLKMGSVNINGTSRIADTDVVYFNASFSDPTANYSITKNITNISFYQENQIQCDEDYKEFEEKAKELTAKIQVAENLKF